MVPVDRKRREFIMLLGASAAWPIAASAQQNLRLPRVGVLWHAASAAAEGSNFDALVRGFADLGYIEGRTIVLEHRFPAERPERFRSMAAELVASNVDVLVSAGANAAFYAKEATSRIPVVFVVVPDPLGSNLVRSLARPEANVTGLTNSASEVIGKRLELFKALLPNLSKVALLVNRNSQLAPSYRSATQAAAAALGISGVTFEWRAPEELEPVFRSMQADGVQALMTNPDGWAFTYRDAIGKLALANGLPLSTWTRQTLLSGALMSYGADHNAIYRRVAVFVKKLLDGAKVGELPIEQPTKFEFLINLTTAKALRLTIPQVVLAEADDVFD